MGRRRPTKMFGQRREPPTPINERIKHEQVRVLSATGQNIGILPIAEAIALARSQGSDLVEISGKANPPVCRIMEMGKFLYQKSKDERKKRQKALELKEVRLGLSTGKHDLEIKAKKLAEFLLDGNQVEIRMVLRGRERANRDFAKRRLLEFLPLISVPYKVTMEPKYIGGTFIMQVARAGAAADKKDEPVE